MAIKFSKTDKKYGCFSNFHNCEVTFDGLTYHNSEAAWQAQKVADKSQRKVFTKYNASQAKQAGRRVNLGKDWEDVKYQLMIDVLTAKFTQNKALGDVLLSTGNAEIIENTTGWHDNIWGNCECDKCINKPGQNLLGKALMEVREQLRNKGSETAESLDTRTITNMQNISNRAHAFRGML